jgi:GDP-L-fucose synthase
MTALTEFYRKKRVLVTGGAGFVGSHLVEALVKLDAEVTVPVRPSTQRGFLKAVESDVNIIEADLCHRPSVDSVMKGQQLVLHLAAAKGGGIAHSMRHHASLFRDNMFSFLPVIDAARCAAVERFLVVSSACVYPRESTIPIPEEEGFRDAPEPTNAGYGWSKRMEEYAALAFAEEFGLSVGIVRPFNAYGPRDDFFRETNHVIPGLITRVFSGEDPLTVWGSGRQTRTFLYVSDFVRGVLLACAHEKAAGPLNLGSDEEISIGELAKLIVELSGFQVGVRFDPSKPDGQPRRACDTRKAREVIGFDATVSIREGLKQTIAWYRQQKEGRAKKLEDNVDCSHLE